MPWWWWARFQKYTHLASNGKKHKQTNNLVKFKPFCNRLRKVISFASRLSCNIDSTGPVKKPQSFCWERRPYLRSKYIFKCTHYVKNWSAFTSPLHNRIKKMLAKTLSNRFGFGIFLNHLFLLFLLLSSQYHMKIGGAVSVCDGLLFNCVRVHCYWQYAHTHTHRLWCNRMYHLVTLTTFQATWNTSSGVYLFGDYDVSVWRK